MPVVLGSLLLQYLGYGLPDAAVGHLDAQEGGDGGGNVGHVDLAEETADGLDAKILNVTLLGKICFYQIKYRPLFTTKYIHL